MIDKLIGQFKKYKFRVAVKNILYHIQTIERRKSYGPENPDKIVYIIRPIDDKSPFYIGPVHNLLANYFYVLSHLQYARVKGWVPVVDQLNYPVYNSQSSPINGTKNAWEYFWEQPGEVTLDEAYRSNNVVLSKRSWFWEWDIGYDAARYKDKNTVAFYSELAAMAKLNEETRDHIAKAADDLLPKGKKVLGVNVRIGGHSAHSAKHGEGHPIQPELEELISDVKLIAQSLKADCIFVSSDTEYAVDRFKAYFGNNLIVYPRLRAAIGTEFAPDSQKNIYGQGKSYQTALDYLTEMELLSRCDALIGSVNSGFRYAVVRNANRFEQIEVIDSGRFDDGRIKKI